MQLPNILMMVADDHRADAIGAMGHPVVRTPHLDTFTFVTVPICTPARAELLTGCCAFRCGVPWFHYAAKPQIRWLPEILKGAGYRTFFTGKWHNELSPCERGFDTVRRAKIGGMWDHELTFEEEGGPVHGFSSELFADAAREFISGSPAGPWFAYVAFTAPHDPRTPPPEFAAHYPPESIPLPPNYAPEHPFDNGEMTIRDEQLEAWPRTPAAIQRHLADYYGMIGHLDAQIGRVLSALEASGQTENTLVVYCGDHGLAIGSHGLMGKMNMYDHSVRVPLLLQGPGVPRGVRSDVLAQSYDLAPTLLDLCGVEIPETVEGRSLGPVLRGETASHREAVFSAYQRPVSEVSASEGREPLLHVQRMARTEHWKLIEYPHLGRTQLFDLERDPHETRDLLVSWRLEPTGRYQPEYDPGAIEMVSRDLEGKLLDWQFAVRDPLLRGNPSHLS